MQQRNANTCVFACITYLILACILNSGKKNEKAILDPPLWRLRACVRACICESKMHGLFDSFILHGYLHSAL